MKAHQILAAALLASLAGLSAPLTQAAQDNKPEEHADHHPEAAPRRAPAPGPYDRQMKAMGEMRQKMLAAKTPEERAALMQEHMKVMQDGMAMMDGMRGGMGTGSSPADGAKKPPAQSGAGTAGPMAMQRRMDMMEMMMQMMMDRQAMPPAGK